jgi:hypothetical protein
LGSRSAKEYKVFVKQYNEVFNAEYEAECSCQGATGWGKLPIWHKVAVELWDKATKEQKEAVQAELVKAKEDANESVDDPSTLSEYQRCILMKDYATSIS